MTRIATYFLAALCIACASQPGSTPGTTTGSIDLMAMGETDPVESMGDAADDPAIWLHPDDPARSLIIGTDKRSGLFIYDLQGQTLQHRTDGFLNNVDLRYAFPLGDGRYADVVAASNRGNNGIELYRVDQQSRTLEPIGGGDLTTDLHAIYGLCMSNRPGYGETYVYATSRDGTVAQYRLRAREDGLIGLRRVRTLKLESQAEGCTVDDRTGQLFIAEEKLGIWRFGAWPSDTDRGVLVHRVGEHSLAADVEGMAIFPTQTGGYLLVASQGNSSFNVYELSPPHVFRGNFRVVDGTVDGAAETDGIEVLATAMGRYGQGLLVIQDGYNTAPQENQNFKMIDLGVLAQSMGLETWPGWDPRAL